MMAEEGVEEDEVIQEHEDDYNQKEEKTKN